MLVFEERGKPEYPEKNLSEQGKEPTTNLTHIWHLLTNQAQGCKKPEFQLVLVTSSGNNILLAQGSLIIGYMI